MRSSLRSRRPNFTSSTPACAANRLIAVTKSRDIGAISADDGTGLPRTLRKNRAAPPQVCRTGT